MTTPRTTQTLTILSGDTVSNVVKVSNAARLALFAPGLTSCQAFIEAGTASSSAGMGRVWRTDGTSLSAWNIGPGSGAIMLDGVAGFTYVRVGVSAAQTAPRSFTLAALN